MSSKTKSKSKIHTQPGIVITSVGILLMIVSFVWKLNQTSLNFNTTYSVENNLLNSEYNIKSISIPKINAFLEIEQGRIINGKWEVSDTGASHYVSSGLPGKSSNVVIYGHNKEDIFGRLNELALGDNINITTSQNKSYTYVVGKIITVSPDQTDVINPSRIEELTIYTCTGLFDSKRLVIKAYPVQLFTNRTSVN